MRDTQQDLFKGVEVINASEIGQYHYCSMAWLLQKRGYEPKSPLLDAGIKRHVEIGNVVDHAQKGIKRSRTLAIVGYLLLIIAVLLVVFEVMTWLPPL